MKFKWLIVAIVLAGLAVGYWTSRRLSMERPEPFSPPPPQQKIEKRTAPEPALVPLLAENPTPRPNPRLRGPRPPVSPSTGILTNWEEKVGEILSSALEKELKEKALLDLFARLPPDGQVETVRQLEKMLPDKDYAPLAHYVTNSALAEPVIEALFDGLLARPERIRLPLLLSIAEDEDHPKSEESLQILQRVFGQTYGTNWDQWSASMDQRLNSEAEDQDQAWDQEMDSP